MSASSSTAVRPLRIGIDGREMQGTPTGVGRYLRSLLRRWEQSPHTFLIYGTQSFDLPIVMSRAEKRILEGTQPLFWQQRTLSHALSEDRADVLLAPAYGCPIFSATPSVTAMHDVSFLARPHEFGFLHGLRLRVMSRLSARRTKSILACSEFTKSEIGRHLGASAFEKTRTVLLGPDDDLPQAPDRAASRAALGLSADESYVVTVGTIFTRRRISTLVAAFSSVLAVHPNARLAIVGLNRSKPHEDPAALAAKIGCEKKVRVTGFVPDAEVAQHYAAADVAVFLSEYEGFGLPALEAMSRGVPTIVANRGSLNEIAGPGALIIEPTVSETASALAQVLSDSAKRDRLRVQGRLRATAFSWQKSADETLRVLEAAAQ